MVGKEKLQELINKTDKAPEEMRKIAEAYLRGNVLKDNVAAEAWFMKVIDSGDHKDSMISMILLAREIWGIEYPVSEKDFQAMRKDLQESEGEERKQLEKMLEEIMKL